MDKRTWQLMYWTASNSPADVGPGTHERDRRHSSTTDVYRPHTWGAANEVPDEMRIPLDDEASK
jgi:hypothetical protein